MRVLIVDDSIVFRSQISKALSEISGITIVGSAPNGKVALQKIEQGSVDLITLDMEMPELDGIGVLKELKIRNYPNLKIIVFSGHTIKGATSALEALALGAHDVVPKPAGGQQNFDEAFVSIRESLLPKVIQFMKKKQTQPIPKDDLKVDSIQISGPENLNVNKFQDTYKPLGIFNFYPSIIVIASSTGGPAALETVFSSLTSSSLSIPILIVQHMPPVFTTILAKRLSDISGHNCVEAENGMPIQPGHIYIAPGDYHLLIQKNKNEFQCVINKNPPRNSVRPAADYLFESAASLFGPNCLGVVLTGMGEDGLVGAKAIKENGGKILIQNKESSVVFGMPGAIFDKQLYDEILPIDQIGHKIYKCAKTDRQAG